MDLILETCKKLSRDNKAVLVFIKEEEDLFDIYKSLHFKDKIYLLTEDQISIDKRGNTKSVTGDTFKKNDIPYSQREEEWSEYVERLIG